MYFISIDGGASKSRGVLFTDAGEILSYAETMGSSLSRTDIDAPAMLIDFAQALATGASVELPKVESINLAVAGVSNEDARKALFKALAESNLADRTLVTSDAEASFEVIFGPAPGAVINVGTGAICWARDDEGNSHRASGLGSAMGGDPGSGYWLGRMTMMRLIMQEDVSDASLDAVRNGIMELVDVETFEAASMKLGEVTNHMQIVARIGHIICEEAAKENDFALGIIQEGTQLLADDFLGMVDSAGLRSDQMEIGINGSIIQKSSLFREILKSALMYDIPEITWKQSKLSPAFGAALLAIRMNELPINFEKLLENWSNRDL